MSWSEPVTFPGTDLRVSRIGLGSSYGLGADDVERAFDAGVNFMFWGLRRRRGFGEGVRRVCRKDRDGVVVALQSYSRAACLVGPSVRLGLRRLGLERADLLVLGWWNDSPPRRIVDAALRLKEAGTVRYVAVSCHHRPSFAKLVQDPAFDVVMVRYNAAHVGAEQDVFPHLTRPVGVLAFTATRWASLLDPRLAPAQDGPLRASDCYRFALSNPNVHACLAGPRDGAELDEALAALRLGPLSPDEDARARRIGATVRAGANGTRVNPVINALDRVRGVRTRAGG